MTVHVHAGCGRPLMFVHLLHRLGGRWLPSVVTCPVHGTIHPNDVRSTEAPR